MGLVVAALAGVGLWALAHRMHLDADARMLGNTPATESMCDGRVYCISGGGLDPALRGKRTIVVAWRTGCLDDEYRRFLTDLAEQHPQTVKIVAAALSVPNSNDRRLAGRTPAPPPEQWPPPHCDPGFDALPVDHGYVGDVVAPPVTYLFDADGALVAVWRGGMAPIQRERLVAWLEDRVSE
jgi:hypothetical protein